MFRPQEAEAKLVAPLHANKLTAGIAHYVMVREIVTLAMEVVLITVTQVMVRKLVQFATVIKNVPDVMEQEKSYNR